VEAPEEMATVPLGEAELLPVARLSEPLEPWGEDPVAIKAEPESPAISTSLEKSSRLPEPVE